MFYQTILLALCAIQVQGSDKQACEPISPQLTSPKTGQKAWDKCVEYQELVYPCKKGASGELARANACTHDVEELIVGGGRVSNDDFTHMAILGYGDLENITWICGAALISDKYVLTTGHCISSREYGPSTFVKMGGLEGSEKSDVYKIKNIITHPEYKTPLKYNDIALLELEKPVELNQFRVPACLAVEGPNENSIAYDASYYLKSFNGPSTKDELRKTVVHKFTTEECKDAYPPTRRMKQGIDEATQMCYGEKNGSLYKCERDSSGPLQVKNRKLSCMYDVIGLASLGRGCGFAVAPVVYTKVSHYLTWIENIVWP